MGAKRFKYSSGFTLVEIMVTITVLLIAVLGTSAFRYHSALSAREAKAKTTAARIAQTLCENWRGANDANEFDPATAFSLQDIFGSQFEAMLRIDGAEYGPYAADGFTPLGYYKIILDDNEDEGDEVPYWVTLSWREVSSGLRALNIVVGWDTRSAMSNYYWEGGSGRTFKLTTYVAN
jgi:prepilin-type N-terminal cleavage/methylation domain-containing protein